MPIKFARFIRVLSLAPDSGAVGIDAKIGKYVAMTIVLAVFFFDLYIAGLFYWQSRSPLPTFVLLTGGGIFSWACTSMGVTVAGVVSGDTIASHRLLANNTAATTAATTATRLNTTALEAHTPPSLGESDKNTS